MKNKLTQIRTSDPEWLRQLLQCCKERAAFFLIDDAKIGIKESDQGSGLDFLSKAYHSGVPWNRIAQALAGIGYCGIGIWLIRVALLDPEPTSRLALLLAGGLFCIITGGAIILSSLNSPIRVKAHFGGHEFGFECNF